MSDLITEHTDGTSSRRAVLATGAAGLAFAAGCGASGEGTAAKEVADQVIGKAADVPVGGSKAFPEAKVIVGQPTAGRYVAFSAVCPHKGCTVNRIEGAEAVCPCHASRFKTSDGTVVGGPAPAPLKSVAVRLRGDDLILVR